MSAIRRGSTIYWLLSMAPVMVSLYLPGFRILGSSIYLGTLYLFLALGLLVVSGKVGFSRKMLLSVLAFNVVNFASFLASGFYLDDFLIATLQYNFFFFFLLVFYSGKIRIDARLYCVACLFPVAYGLLLFFLNPEAVVAFGRFSYIFDNPNSAGLYFLSISGVCLAYPLKSPFAWLMRLFFLGVLFVAIILTGSFGALFGFILLIMLNYLWGAWGLGSRRLFLLTLRAIFVSLLLYVIYYALVRMIGELSFDFDFRALSRIGDVLIGGQGRVGSFTERNQLSEAAIERVMSSKDLGLFGFGLGQGRYSFSLVSGDFTPVHNVFLSLILDVGFIGLILYFHMLRLVCKKFCVSRADWIVVIAFFMGFALTPAIYLPFLWAPTFFYFSAKRNDENSFRYHRAWIGGGGENAAKVVGADRPSPIHS